MKLIYYLSRLRRDNDGLNILCVGNCSQFDAAGSFNSTSVLENAKLEENSYYYILILRTHNLF